MPSTRGKRHAFRIIAGRPAQRVGVHHDGYSGRRGRAPLCAVDLALLSCTDIGVDLMGSGTDLFGRDRLRRLREIGRTFLEERRQRFLGFGGAQPLSELAPFHFYGGFDLVDETLLEKSLASPQSAAWFCCELLRRFH